MISEWWPPCPGIRRLACNRIRKAIEAQGKAVELRKLRDEVKQQESSIRTMQSEIDAIRMALEGGITQFEYDKLEYLDRDAPFMCDFHHNLGAEMKRLYDHGYVRETEFGSGPTLDSHRYAGQPFDMKGHYLLTDKGRVYPQLRREWQKRPRAAAAG